MRLRSKLMLSPMISAVLLVAVLALALLALTAMKDRVSSNQQRVAQAYEQLSLFQTTLGTLHVELYRAIAMMSILSRSQIKELRQKKWGDADQLEKLAHQLSLSGANSEVKNSVQQMELRLKAYVKVSDEALDLSAEAVNVASMTAANNEYQALHLALTEAITKLQEQASEDAATMAASVQRQGLMVGAFGLCAALGSLVLAWFFQGRVYRDVVVAANTATDVASGRLDRTVHAVGNDEISSLLRAIGTMVSRLQTSIASVTDASRSIDHASLSLAQNTSDLSERTQLTAQSLREANSLLEGLTQAVHATAKSADEATSLASRAASVATAGGNEASSVVETMSDIQASSNRIKDITSVIDGLAFQTNILALNAAVEAARAGDQGRGFSVVAAEVRVLAQRSATAAKEIRGLIDANVERVDHGARIVTQARETMSEVLAVVQQVAALIDRISVAAGEQRDGISHVLGTIAQLNTASDQNFALVEQGADAASGLKRQAGALNNVVSQFQLAR